MADQVVTLIDNEGTNLYPVAGALKQGSVTTSTINDGAVTADKIDFTTLGGNYSTNEVDTGFTWINGKHIYKKTIDFGALPNSTNKAVSHGITNLDLVIRYDAFSKDSGNIQRPIIYTALGGSAGSIVLDVEASDIRIFTDSNRSSASAYVTLYYTKSS